MKQKKIIHLELGGEAADVIGWMRSLPHRTVNATVNEILSAEYHGKIARIPCKFSSISKEETMSCRLVIRDGAALAAVAKIPKGKVKSVMLKIIRKHIRKNREMPPAPIGIHGEVLGSLLKSFITKMQAKETEYAGVPGKYAKLCECYDKAYHKLRDEIFACYESEDENSGDARLRALDCDGMIQAVFDDVFGSVEKPDSEATFAVNENSPHAQLDPDEELFVCDEDYEWPEEIFTDDEI